MDYAKESLKLHEQWKGKIEVDRYRAASRRRTTSSLAYTPGVAQPCLEIQKDINKSYELTRRWHNLLRRHHRRHRRPGPGRHRPRGRHARHGGQVRAVQGLRRRGRVPAVREDQGCGRVRQHRLHASPAASAASTSRTSPRRAALRSSASSRKSATFPSSTTTSTAPPSSPWPA